MKRHGLCVRTKTLYPKKAPIDYEPKITEFHRFVITARKKFNFEMNQITNMHEVPLILTLLQIGL